MSTRATYQVNGTTFYCHWDGYPTGAAQRFANMVKELTVSESSDSRLDVIEDRRGGFEYAFVRGNMDAEPTESHHAHGDTEFRYTLRAGALESAFIKVEAVKWGDRGFDDSIWSTVYAGELSVWLDQMRIELQGRLQQMKDKYGSEGRLGVAEPAAEALECIPAIVFASEKNEYQSRDMITYAMKSEAEKIAVKLRAKSEVFQPDNPNRKSYAAKAEAWEKASGLVKVAAAADPEEAIKIVRKFSACGPCLTLGRLVKETDQFYCYDEWQGAERYEGRKRISKLSVHTEPCRSCCDHVQTQYPNGYMD